jgi:hypothetical protein
MSGCRSASRSLSTRNVPRRSTLQHVQRHVAPAGRSGSGPRPRFGHLGPCDHWRPATPRSRRLRKRVNPARCGRSAGGAVGRLPRQERLRAASSQLTPVVTTPTHRWLGPPFARNSWAAPPAWRGTSGFARLARRLPAWRAHRRPTELTLARPQFTLSRRRPLESAITNRTPLLGKLIVYYGRHAEVPTR